MMTIFILVLVLASGFVALLHYLHLRDMDAVEITALSGGIGLALLSLATTLLVLPRPIIIGLLAAIMLLTPLYLYDFYRRRFSEMGQSEDSPREDDETGQVQDPRDERPEAPLPADPTVAPGGPAAPHLALGHTPSGLRFGLVAGLILLAGFLRFWQLGYSEFQGDEARAVLMAHELGRDRDPEVLLRHKKGPLEVLLPAAGIRQGDLGELPARLPFAIAGLLGVMAAFALGARLFGVRAGAIAALLLALDGYLIAFSRIVQYQSLIFLFSVLAIWCAWRFRQGQRDDDRYLLLAAIFLGLGSWAHYEMIFALPPVLWLVFSRGWEERWTPSQWSRRIAIPLLVMAGITFAFYLPFVRHEQFAATFTYIAERRVGGGLPYNMLGDWFARASFYNASYYVVFIALALALVVAQRLESALGRAGQALALVWLAALAVLVARPEIFVIGPVDASPPRSLAFLVFLPVLLALLFSRHLDARWRMLLLWLAGPFFAAAFFVQKPHTHFYTMLPAWLLMAGWGLDRATSWLEKRMSGIRGLQTAGALGAILLATFLLHQHVVFLRHEPEYKRVWPEAKLAGFWQPFETLPRGGYFGFPYRAGWSSVRELYRSGQLSGSYDSNEEQLITGWYTMGAPRCPDQPDYYFVAWRPQDDEDIPMASIEADYHRVRTITVGGRPKLEIYQRERPSAERATVLEDDGSARRQLRELDADLADTDMHDRKPPALRDLRRADRSIAVAAPLGLPLVEQRLDYRFGDAIRLVGVDYPLQSEAYGAPVSGGDAGDDATLPGQGPSYGAAALGLTLVWQPLGPIERNRSVFVHLVDDQGQTVAQSDSWPDCGHAPTASWGRDGDGDYMADSPQFIYDQHRLFMSTETRPEGLPEGTYHVRAGLYDSETGERLPVRPTDAPDAEPIDAVELWSFTIDDGED